MRFIGRAQQLTVLQAQREEVRASGDGRLLLLRGRRQVGKSRLVQEFLQRNGAPAVFFDATRLGPERELVRFSDHLARSTLPSAERAAGGLVPQSWEAALQLAAEGSDPADPAVIVIDEFPYLADAGGVFEATVQSVWDRTLAHAPVLVILVGSDLAMMEMLAEYGRPLYGRPSRELVVPPFTPAEIAQLLGMDAVDALEAVLAVGGFPLVARSWTEGTDLWSFLRHALADPTSPLIVTGERMLAAEFPAELQPRTVLEAIGSGETTFTRISQRSGIPRTALSRPLEILTERKRVVVADRPLAAGAGPSREARYRVADPYLRFWLRFLGPNLELVARGRGDLLVEDIAAGWPSYRGRAVEPLVREAVQLLLPDERFGSATTVGGYWTRTNDVEIDLVGVDDTSGARAIAFTGSVKWRDQAPFGRRDLAELAALSQKVPGHNTATRYVGVSRSGFATADLDIALLPDDLLSAWR